MVVTLNGEPTPVAAGTVAELLVELGHAGAHLAVAVNDDIVRRAAWDATPLAEGDRVEIVTPRQGG